MRRTSDYTAERIATRHAEREQASATRLDRLLILAPGADVNDLKYLARNMTGETTFNTICQVLHDTRANHTRED